MRTGLQCVAMEMCTGRGASVYTGIVCSFRHSLVVLEHPHVHGQITVSLDGYYRYDVNRRDINYCPQIVYILNEAEVNM